MTSIARTSLTCPKCSTAQEVSLYRSVNITTSPELKEQLLGRQLTRFQCSKCSFAIQLIYEMLYHDMHHDYLIKLQPTPLSPDDAPPPRFHGDYQYRVVGNLNKLCEKILILEAGLDDRLVEIIKLGVISDLLTRGRDILAKLKDLPLDVSRILFLHRETSVEGEKSLTFVFLRPHDGVFRMLSLVMPEDSTMKEAQQMLSSHFRSKAASQPPKWEHISRRWALELTGGKSPQIPVEIRFDPVLMFSIPFTHALWGEQMQSSTDLQPPASPTDDSP